MQRFFRCALVSATLAACAAPGDTPPALPAPTAIVDRDQVAEIFLQGCLSAPQDRQLLAKVADRYGMKPLPPDADARTYALDSDTWSAERVSGVAPLSMQVRVVEPIYEVVGDGSGLPTRVLECSVSAYLGNDAIADEAAFRTLVDWEMQKAAKALDFGAAAGAYTMTPGDVRVLLDLPEVQAILSSAPLERCGGAQRCRFWTPTRLTLEVVLDRIP